jgi:hypothetical protein
MEAQQRRGGDGFDTYPVAGGVRVWVEKERRDCRGRFLKPLTTKAALQRSAVRANWVSSSATVSGRQQIEPHHIKPAAPRFVPRGFVLISIFRSLIIGSLSASFARVDGYQAGLKISRRRDRLWSSAVIPPVLKGSREFSFTLIRRFLRRKITVGRGQ